MKKKILIISILFISVATFSQNQKIDSLEKIIKTQSGKEKIETLMELSSEYVKTDIEKSIYYSTEASNLIEEYKLYELKCNLYNSYALINYYKSEYDECFINAQKSIEYSEKYKNEEQKAISYKYCGLIYQLQSKYDTAIICFEKEKEIHTKSKNQTGIALCYYNIGVINQIKGDYKSSIENYLKSEELYTELGEKSKLIAIYGNIGSLYIEQGDLIEAENYLIKAEKGNVEINNFINAARNCNSLGIIYRKQNDNNKALEYYEKALEYLQKQPNKQVECIIYSNIGVVYNNKKNHKEAIQSFKKSADLAEEYGLTSSYAVAYHNIGESYFFLQKYTKAIENYVIAHNIFLEIESYPEILNSYEALIKTNKLLKNYELSLEYYEKYNFLKDSLIKTERNFSIDSLQTVFNTKFLKSENLVLEKETEIKNKTINNQRILILSVLIILILLVVLFVIIIRNSRMMKNFIEELTSKNEEILHQSEELRQINDKLIELSNFKEGMMQMIIHDLKNPLNILQNIRLFATDRQIEKVETISYSMLNLIQDILDVYKYEKSRINLNFESVPVLNLIETSLKEINTLAQNTNIQIVNNLDEKISVKCDINVINRVLINLLTNAIKYSTPKTEIIVEINQKNENQEEIEFTITNQCEEISKENLDKIFDKFWQFGKSTKKYSSGLGLAFCKLAIENHEKTIIVKSDNSKIQFIFCLNKSENIENVRIKTTDNKKIELNLSDKEKNVLKPYLIELLEIPLYNISAINSVIKKIKKEFDSDAVSLFCSELLEQSLKGNQEIFIKTIKNLLIKT